MTWNRKNAIERIKGVAHSIPAIEVSALTREMNLDNVTLGKPKRIAGAHVYCAVANEAAYITDPLDVHDPEAARELARTVHLWQREISRVVEDFDAVQIHFQGTRLHAILYRPVGDAAEIALRALAMAAAVELTTRLAFNGIVGEAELEIITGASYGETLATRSGSRGDSELLFLGDAANQGAKAISKDARLRATGDLVELIDTSDGRPQITQEDDGYFRVDIGRTKVEEIVEDLDLDWSIDGSSTRVTNDAEAIGVDSFKVSHATGTIDKDNLGPSNVKLNHAASAFGDVDGFTALVQERMASGDEAGLVRLFHILRAELRHVTVRDFDTLRVQYQGDRIQALRHLKADDETDRALKAVRLAAAWQSSIEDSIPAVEPDVTAVHLAVGLGAGPTLITKLGKTGNRDVICLGSEVREASAIEGRLDADEVGLSSAVHGALPARVAALFTWSEEKGCYLAKGLRYNDVLLAEEAEQLDGGNGGAKAAATVGGASVHRPRPRWAY
jgi:hypothetical protein